MQFYHKSRKAHAGGTEKNSLLRYKVLLDASYFFILLRLLRVLRVFRDLALSSLLTSFFAYYLCIRIMLPDLYRCSAQPTLNLQLFRGKKSAEPL